MSQPDPLSGLRDQIRALGEATDRLIRDAGAQRTPPPADAAGPTPDAGAQGDLAALAHLVGLLGEAALPPDLRRQVTDLVRELLIVVRTLVDWVVAQLEPPERGRDVRVEDIPIV